MYPTQPSASLVGNSLSRARTAFEDCNQVAVPKRESQVQTQTLRLGNNLDTLSEVLTTLEERLSPLIVDRPPSPMKDESAKDCEQLASLPSALNEYNKRVSVCTIRINQLLAKLEL